MLRFIVVLILLACTVSATKKIIGGTPVQHGVYPDVTWQVGLIVEGSGLCGGAILDQWHIVTAAHCIKDINTGVLVNPALVQVRTGIVLNSVQIFRGQDAWIHPTYQLMNVAGGNAIDLAVIKLNYPIGYSLAVQPIAMPASDPLPPASDFIVSGYGTTVSNEMGSSVISDALLWADVPYVDYATCNAAAESFTVEQTAVCAGGAPAPTKDSCQGDSGGPLVENLGTELAPNFVLVGVVSSGTATDNPLCGVEGEYGIYTSVWPNRMFITDVMTGMVPPDISKGVRVAASFVLVAVMLLWTML